MLDMTITLADASAYSGIPVRRWLAWIREGLITASPKPPEKHDDIQPHVYATLCRIPLACLPRHAARHFICDHVLHEGYFSVDLVGFHNRYGENAFQQLLESIRICKTAAALRRDHPLDSTEALRLWADQNHISLSTLYRKESVFMSGDLKKLVAPPPPHRCHSAKLCLLSQDYLSYHFLKPNAPSQNQLLRDLTAEAQHLGKKACARCPYHPASRSRLRWEKLRPQDPLQTCRVYGKGLLVPSTRYPVNRYLHAVSEQDIALGRMGPEYWTSYFAHKTVRKKPSAVNTVWFGDHHLADVTVIAGKNRKDGTPILARPWLTVVTDAASDAIVGSVVTLRPNSMTIAECFCRAAAFTVDSPFYGLPEVFYVDRGKDYRSLWLSGKSPLKGERLPADACLNRAFCDNPLLPALNVIVRHALPRTGRSKTIERTFGTIARTWFKTLPGWTGNAPRNRPHDYEKEKQRLLAQDGLMTLEQFARYWFEVVVPAYNASAFGNEQSPLCRYQSLPRANTLTPDWNSLAVFKAVQNKKYKVHPNGIHYKGDYYWHPALQPYISHRGKEDAYVQIYDFDQSFCHSISVLYKGQFICEAEPLVRLRMIEADRLRLAQHLEQQKAARHSISRRITRVHQVLHASGVNTKRYADFPTDDEKSVILPLYAEEIDPLRDKQEAVVLSEAASTLGKMATQKQKALEHMLCDADNDPLSDLLINMGGGQKDPPQEK